jgi:hypothetical protein
MERRMRDLHSIYFSGVHLLARDQLIPVHYATRHTGHVFIVSFEVKENKHFDVSVSRETWCLPFTPSE